MFRKLEGAESRCRRDGDGSGTDPWNGCKARQGKLPDHRSFHPVPARIRIIDGHRLGKLCCVGPKVLFENGSGFVDNKSHHTRGAVLHRVSDESESSAHRAIDDVVLCAARRMWSLAREYPKHIPIERHILPTSLRAAFSACLSCQWLDWSIELIVGP